MDCTSLIQCQGARGSVLTVTGEFCCQHVTWIFFFFFCGKISVYYINGYFNFRYDYEASAFEKMGVNVCMVDVFVVEQFSEYARVSVACH